MIMHADQATYNIDTGEVEARGTVRVNFQNTN
jgi:lipopolysaccharide assembly outer membrane protein LptD (OstA)